jgi:hypothetical protein
MVMCITYYVVKALVGSVLRRKRVAQERSSRSAAPCPKGTIADLPVGSAGEFG